VELRVFIKMKSRVSVRSNIRVRSVLCMFFSCLLTHVRGYRTIVFIAIERCISDVELNCQALFIKAGRLSSGLQAKCMSEDIGDVSRMGAVG
jgi:hypothetical protein